MPLTANGNIDRGALPDPDKLRPNLNVPFVAPSTAVEKKLAKIWAEVLGVERVGIHDNFFDLGGHSLLAARLFIGIKKAFGKELFPATLFNAPTIKQLVEIIRQVGRSAARSLLVPIQPDGSKPPFFWACGYSSDIFLPRYLGQDQPLYGLLNQCHDGKRAVYSRLEDIAANHLEEIRAVQPEGPYYLGGFCFGGMVAFEIAQQLKHQGQEVAMLFLVDLATIKNCKALIPEDNRKALVPETESFRDETFRHLGKIVTLGSREKLAYVRVRVADKINQVISHGGNIVNELICRACLISGQPLPPPLRLHYIGKVDRRVLRDYDPQVYPGRIVHIKAEASAYDPRVVEKLTAEGLEMYEESCSHADLIKEPHIHLWAEKLKNFLSKAQAAAMRQQTIKLGSNTETGITSVQQSSKIQLDESRLEAEEFQ
jgi:aspartate racemase